MATTKIDICARALVMIGASPITSFADGTTESTVASNLYEDTIKNMLSSYRWRFASKQAQLSRLTDAPDHKWDSAYQLPSELVGLHGVFVNDMPIKFERYGDMVYNDAVSTDKVYVDYTFYDTSLSNPEIFFPAYFIFTAELTLASIFAFSVAQNTGLSELLETKANRQLAIAKNIDAQQRTSSRLRVTRFNNTRNSTGLGKIEGLVE
jgi:hypothetical protein